jgi:YYY domain-containing protein
VAPGALILGSLYFLNSWDFPAYFVLAQAAAIGGAWWSWRRAALSPGLAPAVGAAPSEDGGGVDGARLGAARPSWRRAAGAVATCGAMAAGLILPFLLTFKPPVVTEGGGLPLGFFPHRSLLSQFLQFWGAQLLLILPLIAAGLAGVQVFGRSAAGSLRRARAAAIVAVESPGWELALLAGAGVLVVAVAERAGAGAFALSLILSLGAGWAAARALEPGGAGRPLAFAFGAISLGALLLAACEVVYIRDFYGGALRRMNTVFKLYYQAWLLFAAGSSVATFWLARRLWRRLAGRRRAFGAFAGLCLLLFGATLFFPYKVTLLRTNGFQNPATLDGMDWMRRFHPEDYAAAQWLQANAAAGDTGVPVVLEAWGGPYSEYARMATQTGFPTVLGWDQHERLWRGQAINAEVETRKRDVDTIYTSATMAQAQPLLEKYGVDYVVVGYLEQAPDKYGASGGLAKFESAAAAGDLQVAFRQGQTTIYKTIQ